MTNLTHLFELLLKAPGLLGPRRRLRAVGGSRAVLGRLDPGLEALRSRGQEWMRKREGGWEGKLWCRHWRGDFALFPLLKQ